MAARKKKTVIDESYSKLDLYAIQLKESHPEWMQEPTFNDIKQHMEDEEE